MKHLEFLKKAAQQGKLAHAYLLSGNDKKGKERAMQDFLRVLLGSSNLAAHPDVSFLEPEKSEITIGQIRRLKAKLSLGAWQGPFKVAVLRQAERMNQEAQSAFLKVLEEPKGSTVFLLMSEKAALLLEPIRSRTQELRFSVFPERFPREKRLLEQLRKAPLADRFALASRLAEDPSELQDTLQSLLRELREAFVSEVQEGETRLAHALRTFQEVLFQLRSTQVNPKLAAERIFLAL